MQCTDFELHGFRVSEVNGGENQSPTIYAQMNLATPFFTLVAHSHICELPSTTTVLFVDC